ncbi:LON peptidase substrate-binding domain-containing protein [bacterium]|nr:LON peptidase substrate-binding domain-containing protein [bacterium]|tara:strand:- start:34062 stop:34751 length:690 start_codon:yes stop_codon:yes gene_type:complete
MKTLFLDFDEDKIINTIPERLPLFPLDNVVFFPNTILPLHIFEERYKQMIIDSSNSHNLICMTLLNPELGDDDQQTLSNTGCIGRIINNEEADDGKKNIILYGLRRIEITKLFYDKPYREAKIKIIETSPTNNSEAFKKRIIELINKWNLLLDGYTDDYKIKIENSYTLSKITDTLSSSMVSKALDRQILLEELDEGIRAEKIIDVLESRIEILSGKIEIPDSESTLIN